MNSNQYKSIVLMLFLSASLVTSFQNCGRFSTAINDGSFELSSQTADQAGVDLDISYFLKNSEELPFSFYRYVNFTDLNGDYGLVNFDGGAYLLDISERKLYPVADSNIFVSPNNHSFNSSYMKLDSAGSLLAFEAYRVGEEKGQKKFYIYDFKRKQIVNTVSDLSAYPNLVSFNDYYNTFYSYRTVPESNTCGGNTYDLSITKNSKIYSFTGTRKSICSDGQFVYISEDKSKPIVQCSSPQICESFSVDLGMNGLFDGILPPGTPIFYPKHNVLIYTVAVKDSYLYALELFDIKTKKVVNLPPPKAMPIQQEVINSDKEYVVIDTGLYRWVNNRIKTSIQLVNLKTMNTVEFPFFDDVVNMHYSWWYGAGGIGRFQNGLPYVLGRNRDYTGNLLFDPAKNSVARFDGMPRSSLEDNAKAYITFGFTSKKVHLVNPDTGSSLLLANLPESTNNVGGYLIGDYIVLLIDDTKDIFHLQVYKNLNLEFEYFPKKFVSSDSIRLIEKSDHSGFYAAHSNKANLLEYDFKLKTITERQEPVAYNGTYLKLRTTVGSLYLLNNVLYDSSMNEFDDLGARGYYVFTNQGKNDSFVFDKIAVSKYFQPSPDESQGHVEIYNYHFQSKTLTLSIGATTDQIQSFGNNILQISSIKNDSEDTSVMSLQIKDLDGNLLGTKDVMSIYLNTFGIAIRRPNDPSIVDFYPYSGSTQSFLDVKPLRFYIPEKDCEIRHFFGDKLVYSYSLRGNTKIKIKQAR